MGLATINREWWIDDVRMTLADVLARGEQEGFGILRMLNRVSFVTRSNLLFVVYTRTGLGVGQAHYHRERNVTVIDPAIHGPFRDYMQKRFRLETTADKEGYPKTGFMRGESGDVSSEPGDDLSHSQIGDYIIQLFGSELYLVIFEMKVSKSRPGTRPEIDFDILSAKSKRGKATLGSTLEEIFKPFDGQEQRAEIGSASYREAQIKRLSENARMRKAAGDTPGPTSRRAKNIIRESRKSIIQIVDDSYERLRKSPLLAGFETGAETLPVCNAFVFGRTFSLSEERSGTYRYDCPLLLPPTQHADICNALKGSSSEDFIPYGVDELDHEFWSVVRSNGGPERVLEILDSGWGSRHRLFVDSSFMSGALMVKPGLFQRGGVGWLWGDDPAEAQDRFKLCALHYILQLGSDRPPGHMSDDEKENLSLVAIPFRCGGGIWAVAAYVRDGRVDGMKEVLHRRSLERQFLIYHSLLRPTEQRFRKKAKREYLAFLGRLLASHVRNVVRRRGSPDGSSRLVLDRMAIEAFNEDTHAISRLFPFARTMIDAPPTPLTNLGDLVLSLQDNPFFDRINFGPGSDKSFLGDRFEIAETIVSQAMLYLRDK